MVAEHEVGDSASLVMSSRTSGRDLLKTFEKPYGRRTCGVEHRVGEYATCAGVWTNRQKNEEKS